MPFSKEWDKVYENKNSGSFWPWSDLISLYYKINSDLPNKSKVLELGFGKGANIPFFIKNNINYFGVEGSKNAFNQTIDNYPGIKNKLFNYDFTHELYKLNCKFDLVFDRASISHNNKLDISKIILQISKILNDQGYFIGIDWFSDEHYEFGQGFEIDDKMTKLFHKDSYFGGFGKVHFVNEVSLREYFGDIFSFIYFEKKIKIDIMNHEKRVFYDFILKKNK